ncbi:PPE domain-containing protein [Nocardia sp. NPDC003963]
MAEITDANFTGVVWEAKLADQLAHELADGPGALPMAEAAAAWGHLALAFAAAAAEFGHIVTRIDEVWESDGNSPVSTKLSVLQDWLAETAAAATGNATRAGAQTAAYEVARLAMPHADEIAGLEAAKRGLEQVGMAIGAPLIGSADQIDTQRETVHTNAVRAMRGYETATAPLAAPWDQRRPPVIVNPVAAAEKTGYTSETAAGGLSLASASPVDGVPIRRVPGPYQGHVVAAETTVATTRPVTQATPATSESLYRGTPTASPVHAFTENPNSDRSARAGAASGTQTGASGFDAAIVAAPAVLGGVATTGDDAAPDAPASTDTEH